MTVYVLELDREKRWVKFIARVRVHRWVEEGEQRVQYYITIPKRVAELLGLGRGEQVVVTVERVPGS